MMTHRSMVRSAVRAVAVAVAVAVAAVAVAGRRAMFRTFRHLTRAISELRT